MMMMMNDTVLLDLAVDGGFIAALRLTWMETILWVTVLPRPSFGDFYLAIGQTLYPLKWGYDHTIIPINAKRPV